MTVAASPRAISLSLNELRRRSPVSDPLLTSLVYIGSIGEEQKKGCPRGSTDSLNLDTGDRFATSCRVLSCPYCGPIQAQARSQLAFASRPERLVTLTQAPSEWQECREWTRNIVHKLRQRGYSWEWFWAREENPKKTGHHVHGVQHGDFVPQPELQEVTGSIVHITRVQAEAQASRYVLKGAGRAGSLYVAKGAVSDLEKHLELNGGRAAHWSRHFMRTDANDPITAKALQAVLQKASTARWMLIPKTTTPEQVLEIMREEKGREG